MGLDERHVVTVFLRHESELLLLCRSDAVGTYRGRWAGVSGDVDGTPDDCLDDARRELREETRTDPELVREGDPVEIVDEAIDRRWIVHPFLFEATSRDVTLDEEAVEGEWVSPPVVLERETVPGLWTAYERVAPTVETIRTDREHGAAELSLRALEVLRDRAARRAAGADAGAESEEGLAWAPLADLARRLRDVRSGLTVIANRINRAMHDADGDPAAVQAAAEREIRRSLDADGEAAASAADRVGNALLTLSRSGTVSVTVVAASPERVYVAESRPGGEGVPVAEAFATSDSDSDAGSGSGGDDTPEVTLLPDAAVAHALAEEPIDAVVVGADAVLPDGRVVNKVGTRGAALAAANEGIPLYAVTSRDKVLAHDGDHDPDLEPLSPEAVYDGTAPLSVLAPTFDVTPADRVTVVCEDGALDAGVIEEVAAEHRRHADWPGADAG
jgi:translation initiation factor 2B subunit (eIF-2B alpha/beta/delta family)/8-oxo-dGTP pyrophosphatase MutT (NUDIX family)